MKQFSKFLQNFLQTFGIQKVDIIIIILRPKKCDSERRCKDSGVPLMCVVLLLSSKCQTVELSQPSYDICVCEQSISLEALYIYPA